MAAYAITSIKDHVSIARYAAKQQPTSATILRGRRTENLCVGASFTGFRIYEAIHERRVVQLRVYIDCYMVFELRPNRSGNGVGD